MYILGNKVHYFACHFTNEVYMDVLKDASQSISRDVLIGDNQEVT